MNSICIATYNGANYIEDQIFSILSEIGKNDEIIIVDDNSTDTTVDLLEKINDSRINIYKNSTNKGPTLTFNRAISLSKGNIIFMADQDDIWTTGRINLMIDILEKRRTMLVSSNFDCFDNSGNKLHSFENKIENKKSSSYFKNIIDIFYGKSYYYGCAMAFKNEFLKIILPIPTFVESHDLWIALAANILKSNTHLEKITLHRRIHGKNASIVKRNLYRKIISRLIFIISIFIIIYRKRKLK